MTTGIDGEMPRRPMSEVERIVDVFVAPTKTFRDLRRDARWWAPFLLLVLVTFADTAVIDRQVGFGRVVENQIQLSAKQQEAMGQLSPELREQRVRGMATGYRYTSYAAPLFVLAFAAIGALLLWASFNFGLGTSVRYREMLALWMYASLPRLLLGLLTIGMLLAGVNTEGFDLKNPVGTNPAFYLPEAVPAVRTALSFLDVIGLWTMVLLVIGAATVAGTTRAKAALVVVGWWVAGLVVSTALAAAF